MKPKHTATSGEVFIEWRFRHCWRDGSNHDRHFKFYAVCGTRDAKKFLEKKAPADEMFEFRMRDPHKMNLSPGRAITDGTQQGVSEGHLRDDSGGS